MMNIMEKAISVIGPGIKKCLKKIALAHGSNHPELYSIHELFNQASDDLAIHMKKEELMLFPFIRKMVQAQQAGTQPAAAPFGAIQNPIRMMMHEHDSEGERFRKIRELSNVYTAPADGCNTYRAAFANLREFEDDLHLHIHLENNILFPKSIELEQSLN